MHGEDLLALAERCEKATGPDRRLDAEIDATLRIGKPTLPEWAWKNFDVWRPKEGAAGRVELAHANGKGGVHWEAQSFTASLDAAVALVERVLPGWDWEIQRLVSFSGPYATAELGDQPQVEAATPALALVAACLRALSSQPQEGGNG